MKQEYYQEKDVHGKEQRVVEEETIQEVAGWSSMVLEQEQEEGVHPSSASGEEVLHLVSGLSEGQLELLRTLDGDRI
jgi:hypothetical protein